MYIYIYTYIYILYTYYIHLFYDVAETQKEIEEMLAGIPKSPTTVTGGLLYVNYKRCLFTIVIDESRTEMAISFPDEESHIEQLNKMFPHAGNGNDESTYMYMYIGEVFIPYSINRCLAFNGDFRE